MADGRRLVRELEGAIRPAKPEELALVAEAEGGMVEDLGDLEFLPHMSAQGGDTLAQIPRERLVEAVLAFTFEDGTGHRLHEDEYPPRGR